MFKHYLTTALRHFRQHKVTTGINVACLAMGLACFILAWGTMAYFSQADAYHSRAERTYFVSNALSAPNSKFSITLTTTPWPLAESLRIDFPQLESVARSTTAGETPVSFGNTTGFASVAFADPSFTRIFDLPFIAGDGNTALNAPRSAIVSSTFARRFFGKDNVVGRTLRVANQEDVTITGVISSISRPSHMSTDDTNARLYFEALLSMDTHVAIAKATMTPQSASGKFDRWGFNSYLTYLVLPTSNSAAKKQFDVDLGAFSKTRVPTTDGVHAFRIHPITTLTESTINTIAGTDATGISSSVLVQMLGGFVLLVSCLNYANLATAQAVTRAKEIALQKIVGASVRQVMLQYFFEASLLAWFSLAIALAGIGLVMLSAGATTFAALTILFARMPQFWICIALLLLVVSLAAGAYPALALSRVRPIHALQNARAQAGSKLAATLVGLQFGFASFLLITVFVMIGQNETLRRAVANPSSDPVVIITNDIKNAGIDHTLLKTELMNTPGVVGVTGIQYLPWSMSFEVTGVTVTPDTQIATSAPAYRNIVGSDFFTTLDIPILAGRAFEDRRASDITEVTARQLAIKPTDQGFNVVIDRTLARSLGFIDTQDAVGKVIYGATSQDASTPPALFNVIGVAENTTLRPLGFGISGSVYLLNPAGATIPLVRISKSNVQATVSSMDDAWHRLVPSETMKRRFADEQFDQAFRFLYLLSGMFTVLAAFASAIAVMGLVGMALHIIRRRTHEIGVRKTLGASVHQILLLLLRSFSKPVIIANIAVWPIVYLAMSVYLKLFAQRIALSPLPFVASLLITLLIAWLAVAIQASRAARMNPAVVLRHE